MRIVAVAQKDNLVAVSLFVQEVERSTLVSRFDSCGAGCSRIGKQLDLQVSNIQDGPFLSRILDIAPARS